MTNTVVKLWVAWGTFTLGLAGCAAGSARAGGSTWVRPWIGTLRVENRSADHIALRLGGLRVATLTPGRSCVMIPLAGGELLLELDPLAGAAWRAPPVRAVESLHWQLDIGPGEQLEHDVLSLRPAPGPCAPASGSLRNLDSGRDGQ
jgi:hypothetical protein